MRFRSRSVGARALILAVLPAVLAGCSAGSPQNSVSTANLAPVRDDTRYSDNRSNQPYALPHRQSDRSYAARQYVDPGRQTPREYAAYDSGHPTTNQTIQTGSLGASNRGPYSYDPNARWQQPAHGTRTPAAYAPHAPHVIEVRQGDTLFGLSRRYNVPIGDLVAANRLPNERIAIGQRLVIPERYR